MSEVVKFNSHDMAEKLREDVKKLVIAAIPAETIDAMIQETYSSYFTYTGRYNDNKTLFKQDVERIIYQESQILITSHVKAALSNPELLSNLTQKVIEEALPQLTNALVRGMAKDLLHQMGKPGY